MALSLVFCCHQKCLRRGQAQKLKYWPGFLPELAFRLCYILLSFAEAGLRVAICGVRAWLQNMPTIVRRFFCVPGTFFGAALLRMASAFLFRGGRLAVPSPPLLLIPSVTPRGRPIDDRARTVFVCCLFRVYVCFIFSFGFFFFSFRFRFFGAFCFLFVFRFAFAFIFSFPVFRFPCFVFLFFCLLCPVFTVVFFFQVAGEAEHLSNHAV